LIVPHSRLTIDQDDIKAVADVLASGMIAQGVKVKEFEDALAGYVGVKYGVAVYSGTAALHLALLGLGVGPGDEVVIPSYVCSSLYFAVRQAGAVPKIADISLQDLNICAEEVGKLITPKTRAVVVPHMFGTPAELEELLELGVPIIEDCAQALGAEYKGRKVGSFGEMSVFSFYATKVMTTGEGGMILTNKEDLYLKVKDLREYDKKPLSPVKYNYKMTDFQAAMGLSQLGKLESFIKRRRQIASGYSRFFSRLRVKSLEGLAHRSSIFYRYIIMVDALEKIQTCLKEAGVVCERPVAKPLHHDLVDFRCPNSDEAYGRALSVPLYPSLSDAEISYVLETFDNVVA